MNVPFVALGAGARRPVRVVRRRPGRRRGLWRRALTRAGLGVLALVGVALAGAAGWIAVGGDPAGLAALVDTLPLPWATSDADLSEADGPTNGGVPLHVTTQPPGAHVLLDGRDRGKAPLVVAVQPGTHDLVVKHPDALDEARQVEVGPDGGAVQVALWSRRPEATRLHPAVPGATIADAAFLADGRVALTVALPERQVSGTVGSLREAWLLDPGSGRLEPFSPMGPRAAAVAVSPDGRRLAYLQQAPPPPPGRAGAPPVLTVPGRLDEVWVASAGDAEPLTRVFSLPPVVQRPTYGAPPVERLLDLAWAADGRSLLVATQLGDSTGGGPSRSRLLLLDGQPRGQDATSPPPVELLTVPAEVVPGSYSWAPDGHWVAFLVRASSAPGGKGLLSLVALDIGTGSFRYLADLGRAGQPTDPLPVPPVAWQPAGADGADERLVYVAPVPGATSSGASSLFGLLSAAAPAEPPSGLFVATPAAPDLAPEERRRLGTTTGVLGPVWRGSRSGRTGASLLGLVRTDQGGQLALRWIDPASGRLQDLGMGLPAEVAPRAAAVAVRWDAVDGRALVLARPPAGRAVAGPTGPQALDAWLITFARPLGPSTDQGTPR